MYENLLQADDSHEIPHLIFSRRLGRMSQKLSSVAVIVGVSRVNCPLSPQEAAVV